VEERSNDEIARRAVGEAKFHDCVALEHFVLV
jgi:hypothetical protein